MRALPLLLVSTAWLGAQSPRLIDRIEAPIAYVCLDGQGGAPPDRDATLPRLLADPGLATFVGANAGPMASAWSLIRGVVGRTTGEFELALTGIEPAAGQPQLLVRLQLPAAEAARLQALLQQGAVGTACRTLGSRQTYRLRDRDGSDQPAAGSAVELAVVDTDLLVGNDPRGIQDVLTPAPAQTSASPQRRVLSADPQFIALRQRLAVPAGSLFAYGDWPRLGNSLQPSLSGLPGSLLDWSGLGGARRIMLALAPSAAAFEATLLLAFDGEPGTPAPDASAGVDGWLAAAQPVAARQLLPELPAAGLGGVVFAVDLGSLAARSHRGEHLLHDLRHSFEEYGLDFDRHVLGRLGSLGTVQVLLRDDVADAAAAAAVYAVRAKSRKAAGDLFTDLRRAAEAHGIGRLLVGRDRRLPDVLELRPQHEPAGQPGAPICVAVVEDTVLVTLAAETIHRVHEDYRRSAKARGRRDAAVAGAIQRIGGVDVCGLFDVDLAGLFASFAGSMAAAGTPLDLSGVPSRHIGYLALEPHENGSLVRVCVLSSR